MVVTERAILASTGPRSFERGNRNEHSNQKRPTKLLQRGRAHSSAEIVSRHGSDLGVRVASTGPRSFERGNAVRADLVGTIPGNASTGPRSFERGNLELVDSLRCEFHMLQRGRAHSSAEIPAQAGRLHQDATASTGPRSFERGNALSACACVMRFSGFNGAALIRARKYRSLILV